MEVYRNAAGASWAQLDERTDHAEPVVFAKQQSPAAEHTAVNQPPDRYDAYDEVGGADAIAQYQPWHLYGADWGIYILESPFWSHVRRVTRHPHLRERRPRNAAVVVHSVLISVLSHEYTHVAGEALGTRLEVAMQRSCYRDYVLEQYRARNPSTVGAPEEMLATRAEVASGQAPIKTAIGKLAEGAPPGYREWREADDPLTRAAIETFVASSMAGVSVPAIEWPRLSESHRGSVPIYWCPSTPRRLPLPPGLKKSVARLTPRPLRRWLQDHAFKLNPHHTGGHHFWYERGSVVAAFSVQGGGRSRPRNMRHSRRALGLQTRPSSVRR